MLEARKIEAKETGTTTFCTSLNAFETLEGNRRKKSISRRSLERIPVASAIFRERSGWSEATFRVLITPRESHLHPTLATVRPFRPSGNSPKDSTSFHPSVQPPATPLLPTGAVFVRSTAISKRRSRERGFDASPNFPARVSVSSGTLHVSIVRRLPIPRFARYSSTACKTRHARGSLNN